MDIAVFITLEVFAMILTLYGFMGKKAGWQIFPLFGAMVSLLTAYALFIDGDLVSGSTVLASANGSFLSDFGVLTVLATVAGASPLFVAARRIFHI